MFLARVLFKHKHALAGDCCGFKFLRCSVDGKHSWCVFWVKPLFSNFPDVVLRGLCSQSLLSVLSSYLSFFFVNSRLLVIASFKCNFIWRTYEVFDKPLVDRCTHHHLSPTVWRCSGDLHSIFLDCLFSLDYHWAFYSQQVLWWVHIRLHQESQESLDKTGK